MQWPWTVLALALSAPAFAFQRKVAPPHHPSLSYSTIDAEEETIVFPAFVPSTEEPLVRGLYEDDLAANEIDTKVGSIQWAQPTEPDLLFDPWSPFSA